MATTNAVTMSFPGCCQVVAKTGGYTIFTDQPVDSGGEGSAPSPYTLFIASIGACAGFYALAFFQKRNLSTDGLKVVAHPRSEDGTLAGVDIEVTVPVSFPEKYRGALLRSIDQCSVKRAIQAQPEFRVTLAEEPQSDEAAA